MAEEGDSTTDDSQKTEDPTPRKLEEARKKGQVIHSREINNWMVLFSFTGIILIASPYLVGGLKDLLANFLSQSATIPTDEGGMGKAIRSLLTDVAGYIILPLLAISLAGVVSGFFQTGPLFTLEPLKPDLSKISIIKGMGRLFSAHSISELVKGIIKISLVSIAGLFVIMPYMGGMEHFVGLSFPQSLYELESLFLKMMIAVLSILFIVSIFDYLYQRAEFMKKMRMSKQEIMDEHKQTEGDPHVKARLKQLREQKARQRMMQAVPTADVVITNPTHYAVALRYDSKAMDAPVMVAKGMDAIAEKIKEVAKENKVPIVENPALARALFSAMEIDDIIPKDYYKAVAEVISYVFKLKGKKV